MTVMVTPIFTGRRYIFSPFHSGLGSTAVVTWGSLVDGSSASVSVLHIFFRPKLTNFCVFITKDLLHFLTECCYRYFDIWQ